MSTRMLRMGAMGFVVGIFGLGCNGQTYIGTPAGSGGATGDTTTNTTADAAPIVDSGPRVCPAAGQANTPTTIDAMRTALVGDWLLCSPLGLFRRAQEGIRIASDDRWAYLERDATGNVVRASGVDFEGSVQYLELGDHIQVNFASDLMQWIYSAPVITKAPTVLIISNEGVDEYRYVRPDGG